MKKTIILALIAVTALLVAACDADPITPPGTGVSSLSDFSAYYEDGMLSYSAIIDKPTPCHEVNVEEVPGAITRIEFTTSMPDPGEVCAQVITPEEFENSIEMEKPDTILIYIDGVLASEESVEEANGVPENDDGLVIGDEDFSAWYDDGLFRYFARIEKPTPCHQLEVEELIMESYPVQVRVNIDITYPDPELVCIQVIDVEEVHGSIDIDHVPASFSLYVNGEEMFRTSDIEEI